MTMLAPIAPSLSRRGFLTAGAALGGGLLMGFRIDVAQAAVPSALPSALPPGVPPVPNGYSINPNAFVAIAPDGKVTFQIPQEEMGQGVYTSLSQLIADDLDVALDRVTPVPAPPVEALYGSPGSGRMGTGGSRSVRSFYTVLRVVGASARAMLVQAAADRWQVDPKTLRTDNGEVIDDANGGRRLSYGELAQAASALPVPTDVVLKADKDLKLIGKPVHRLDTPAKVNGTAQYGIDVRLPGLRIATLAASPVVGGKVAHVDDGEFKKLPGLQLVVLDDIVAVVGPHFWAAKTGLDALDITWDGGPDGKIDSPQLWQALRETSAKPGALGTNKGDTTKAEGDRLDVAYELPFLSHAPMEPQNFTVHVKDGGCEMWGGSQVQAAAWNAAAKVLGIKPEKVVFHNYMLGGGFGRRLDVDMVTKAVRIAQKVDGPVKVVWTREEDITQDVYRPAYRNVMSATLKDGKVTGWSHRIAAGSVAVRMSGKPLDGGLDRGALEGATENNYGVPNFHVEFIEAKPRAINVGYWRGVAPNNNVFASESLMDELALKAGQDPVAFRLAHLSSTPRLKAAVERVAKEANWGSPLPSRVGRGICAQFAFGTFIATIAEAEVDTSGHVRVRRMTSVIDAGRVVNPDGMLAQVQGGLIFGLTAALYGEITIKDGRVEQRNFNDYRMMRINEAPSIDVYMIENTEAPGGIGEPGVTAAAPSLVNAIAAATGVRLRRLPIDRDKLAERKTASL
ncbi:xanthine dehydrogenase family protein molybdopterin-binding subunit [Acidisphaera sp. L21]|uniref:xanthine dehydrogenase family protein molybdopterin-binding subunit n=1 Tax=Acidisphaera sp. L21 TaxID=1641851 RepID=UPI00131E0579|nr:molybdopterin cofactor-binding domain-containing protein [Acidisphaera sp. L21]